MSNRVQERTKALGQEGKGATEKLGQLRTVRHWLVSLGAPTLPGEASAVLLDVGRTE